MLSDLHLGSLRHLLRPCDPTSRGGLLPVKVSDLILGTMIITAILVLLIEGASYLASALQTGNPGFIQ